MNNKGFEMALTWNDKVKDFQYNVAFNLSYYKNEVTELTEEIYYTYGGGNGVDKTLVGQRSVHGWASRQMECSVPSRRWMSINPNIMYSLRSRSRTYQIRGC